MLRVLRDYDLGASPRGVGGFDLDVLEPDQDYLCLAWHGRGHFRLPGVVALEAARIQTPNAAASYARHHLAALRWAGLARREPSLQTLARALATLDEGYALHFLEDATAAGHLVVSAATSRQGRVRAMHDHYNAEGVTVTLPAALCRESHESPRLRARCAVEGAPTGRLRGDQALAQQRDRGDPEDVTREVAVLAVQRSLAAVLAAAEAPQDACTEALSRCATEAPDPTHAALRCASVWHLEGCALGPELDAAVGGSALGALGLLPEPAGAVVSRENFSEGATVLSLSTRALALPWAPALVTTLGVGRAYFSPSFNGHQVTFGAELTASWGVSEATLAALPSLVGARGWFRWALFGANAGRARFLGVGVSVEGLRQGGSGQSVLSGVGLGLQLVPFGFTLETSERSTVRVELLLDGLLPLFGGASPSVLAGVGLTAALR
jgi:hypothetical protein